MRQRIGLADVAPALADDHAEFDFPVGFERATRNLHRIIRAAHRAGPLVKDHGFGRHLHAALRCVVGVIQSDTDKFAHAGYTSAQA